MKNRQRSNTNVIRGSAQRGLIILAAMGNIVTAQAADFAQVVDTQLQTLAKSQEAQVQVESLDDKTASLLNEYRSTLKHQDDLEKYNSQLAATIASQQAEMNSLQTQLLQIKNLDKEVIPLMVDMITTLEEFIALDMPFQIAERRSRVRNLKTLMANSSISHAEKYRRILEAYQIENDYGITIEAWDAPIETAALGNSGVSVTGDVTQSVTFLKVGRIAYYYQTLNGSECYLWNSQIKNWQLLDKKYNKAIQKAVRMAREQTPFDLLSLPIIKA